MAPGPTDNDDTGAGGGPGDAAPIDQQGAQDPAAQSANTPLPKPDPKPVEARPEDVAPADAVALADVNVLVTSNIQEEVEQALELADYIVRNGLRHNDNRLPTWILKAIKVTAGRVGLSEYQQAKARAEAEVLARSRRQYVMAPDTPVRDAAPISIKASEWTGFELAYYALAEFSSPITVDTLRNTRQTGWWPGSPAQKFTRVLWCVTIAFIICVLIGGIITTGAEASNRSEWRDIFRKYTEYVPILVPWMYGGLGACAYLLRSAHDMIAKRCFDVRRQPEYYNRILLGAVSGGSIVLLVSPAGDDGDVTKISAAALGFLAGYSNDLLFNAVERVTTALLPKIGLDTAQKEKAVHKPIELLAGGLTMDDLLKRMEATDKPDDKAFYRSLLEKLRDRL